MPSLRTLSHSLLAVIVTFLIAHSTAWANAAWSRADSLYAQASGKFQGGEPSAAMEDLFNMIEICENKEADVPHETYSRACLMIGNIYLSYGDNHNAARFYDRGLSLTSEPGQRLKFIYNLSAATALGGDEKRARHYNAMLKKLRPADKALWLYDCSLSDGIIEKSYGDPARSVAYYKKALSIVDSLGLSPTKYAVGPLSEIVDYYKDAGMLDSVRHWLGIYENVALKSHYPYIIADCQRNFMELYIRTGERDKALEYSRRYLESMDSLVNVGNFMRVTSKRERLREATAEARIKDLQFTVSKQKFIIMAIVAIVVLAAIIWLVAKRMRGDRMQLFARNHELAILETEIKEEHMNHDEVPADDSDDIGGETSEPADDTPQRQWHDLMRDINRVVSDPVYFCDPDFSINTLARLCNSNTRYISQAINETTGDNFRALINGFRIREARRRLTSDPSFADLTISSVGESVGFKSASNFINAFKKVTGMTPSLYQRMAKNSAE